MWTVGQRVEVTITRQDGNGNHLVPPRTVPGTVTAVLPKGQTQVHVDGGEPRFYPPDTIRRAAS